MKFSGSSHAQTLELSNYIDRAELVALASSYGPLPPAEDQETASEYRRFLRLMDESGRELSAIESNLKQRFTEEVSRWDAAEDDRLAREPLSQERIATLKTALRETLNAEQRLADQIPVVTEIPSTADASRPILGMNFRVPRHYLVDEIFHQTYADPAELGHIIARGFMDAEERKILGELRSRHEVVLAPTARAIRQQIDALEDGAQHYVLVTPYGGLLDIEDWYSPEFRASLSRVAHIETAALDDEAILFDRRRAATSCRLPETKYGLAPVEGTTLALGIFEDVQEKNEPQVRIETGEFFVVWASDGSHVYRFATPASDDEEATLDAE
jgi:hypothetical protein